MVKLYIVLLHFTKHLLFLVLRNNIYYSTAQTLVDCEPARQTCGVVYWMPLTSICAENNSDVIMTQKVWGVEMSHTGWGYHELVANHRAGSDGEPRAQETRNNLLRYRIHYCIGTSSFNCSLPTLPYRYTVQYI